MPLLRLSRRLARAERITAADLFDAPAERVIASARIFLCAMSLVAVQVDPSQPARYATAVTAILWTYFAIACAVAFITSRQRPRRWLVRLIHFGDILATLLLLLLTEGPGSPFFAFFTFVLL